jgi:hypothetical protein
MHKKFWSEILKRLFGRPRRRLKDNIRMYFREVGWEDADGIRRD